MKSIRITAVVLFALFVGVSSTWAGSRPPSNALLLFRDGTTVTGDVFTVGDGTVSMLTDRGIVRYDRVDVSQLVFLEDWNALVLRVEGDFVDEANPPANADQTTVVGTLYYVGGVWDGRSAGRFTSTAEHVSGSGNKEQLLVRTTYDIVRNTMPRGTLETLWVTDGQLSQMDDGYLSDHAAGVISGGTGDYEACQGTVDAALQLDLEGPERHVTGIVIFRFDAVH